MNKKLWVGNLHWNVDEARLEGFFAAHGITALSSLIIRDPEKVSRGFGFITVAGADEAKARSLTGRMIEAQKISVRGVGEKPLPKKRRRR